MPCTYSYLQVHFYKRLDGAVSITVVLEKSENKVEGSNPKVEGSSPSKAFFFYFFFAFAKMQEIFAIYICAEKKHVLMFYAHVKRLPRILYGDTASMQQLLLKTCTRSAWRKRSLE